jgi:DNA topoisomerase VI subunit A
VSKRAKHQEFHFSLGVLFRWLLFSLIIYFSINYLSGNQSSLNTNINTQNINILGVSSQPVIIKATATFNDYKNQATDYLNRQIIDIKKQVVTQIYQNILKSIDNSQK